MAMTPSASRLVLAVILTVGGAACALRAPNIADLRTNPGRYQGRTVRIEGVVTSSWGVPAVPIRYYRVDDGSGQVTVLSRGTALPTRGARVRVSGRVGELAVLGGEPLGLHLREEHLDIRRR
jgi:hypothetical protein